MRLKKLFSGLLIGMIAFTPMAVKADEKATIRFILTVTIMNCLQRMDVVAMQSLQVWLRLSRRKQKEIYIPFWFILEMHILLLYSQVWIKERVL